MSIIEHIIAALAPHTCLACQKEGSLICYDCQKQIPVMIPACYRCGRTTGQNRTCRTCAATSPLWSVLRAAPYEGITKQLVYGMKFERQKDSARVIAQILARHLAEQLPAHTVITNVPTASSRVRQRGYDQAAEIARHLSRLLRLPYASLLVRRGQARQVGQSRSTRLRQLHEAFRICAPLPQQLLLIDDVLTTGATLEAAARTLRAGGAGRVSAAVFAVAE